MTIADKLVAATAGSGAAGLKGDSTDVFSTYVYEGNGSTQAITNGIDLAGEGGMVWIKHRGQAYDNSIYDTQRGETKRLVSNGVQLELTRSGLVSFNSDGFSLGADATENDNTGDFVSWTFRKAPKFFDVVTWTGDGVAGRQIPHNLGIEPGMIIVKCTSNSEYWLVQHRSVKTTVNNLPARGRLDDTGAFDLSTNSNIYWPANPTDVDFSVGSVNHANANGFTYVAYVFAHDPAEDGIIQCGSFTTDGSGNASVDLGWEPQYLLIKRYDGGAINWYVVDSMRGFTASNLDDNYLNPDSASAENNTNVASPTATGFTIAGGFGASQSFIYLAIRRPNRVPTSGTEVFAVDTLAAALPSYSSGFVVDLAVQRWVAGVDSNKLYARLMQGRYIATTLTNAESGDAYGVFDYADGWNNTNSTSTTTYSWMFKRAPKFMDVVCDTGTGTGHAVNHNLTVVPELIIRKSRSNATQWEVWHSAISANEKLVLNTTAAKITDSTAWNNASPTDISFSVGSSSNTNANSATYVTYLFATLPKVSKVGSYTGNGSSQTIDCGFVTGARFILIKRTDSTGDWYIWDSVRGIVAANDPHLSLNTTAAQVTTDDSVDPDVTGFIVNQNTSTNINVSAANYIFLAIA